MGGPIGQQTWAVGPIPKMSLPLGPEIPRFPESDFKTLGALRSMMIG